MINDLGKYMLMGSHTTMVASFRNERPHLVAEIMRIHQLLMTGFPRETGIPASQFAVMRLLASSDNGLGTMDLARVLGVNAAAVTRQLQALEREGLVRRRADARDGRRSYVQLSAAGVDRFEKIHARAHDLERHLSSAVGPRNLATATRTLARVRARLESLVSARSRR
jgi:DNA-binding MarR family transcriptional regulator